MEVVSQAPTGSLPMFLSQVSKASRAVNSKGRQFKSLLYHLQHDGFLNHFEPLENKALNIPPHGIMWGEICI